MKNNLVLGRYLPGDSFIHKLNPRIKIVSLLIILAMLFSFNSFLGLLILLALGIVLFLFSGIPLVHVVKSMKPIMYIALIALFVFFFFTKGGVVLLRFGDITIESEGVREGFFIVTRLINLLLYSLLVTLSSTPLSLAHGLSYFIRPLKRVNVPVEEVTMVMAITLRFIPTLIEESGRLMIAQSARGVNFETGSIIKKAKNLTPLVVPLFISAFRRADELALAMEARGYCIGAVRTRMNEDIVSLKDLIIPIVLVIILIATLILDL